MKISLHRLGGPANPRLWLVLCGLALLPLFAQTSRAAALRQTLVPGHVPAEVQTLQSLARVPESQQLNLAISLPWRNKEDLANLLQGLYDPASPRYHQFLTPEQFTAQFGPSEADYEALAAFATSHGLMITTRHPNRAVLSVTGAASDIEKAFNITLRTYPHPKEARTFHAPDREPSLDLAVPVLHISGLDDFSLPRPMMTKKPLSNTAKVEPNAGSGPGGTYMGDDFRAAYVPGTLLNGSGQSVGLLQFDGYNPNDIVQYEALAGRPNVTLVNVLVDGATGFPGFANGEVCLDIEMVMSMAPAISKIYVYMAPNPSPWVDILSRMANDNLSRQLSCSWGGGPPDAGGDQIFQQMAAQGQSFYNACGDSDAFVGFIPFPAESPYITQVGGTTLSTSGPVAPWLSERVWNWGGGIGTCGGVSVTYPIPVWQQGIDMTSSGGSTTMRNIPDVALTADNVFVVADNGTLENVGGTSCAAPLWAGFTALINQQGAQGGQPPVGFINPAVYSIGRGPVFNNAFHDTTTGDNTWFGSPNSFFAVLGYDLCTGWGTPTGTNLINLLVSPAQVPVIVVLTNTLSGGNGNGVIDPDECNAFSVVLANTGTRGVTNIHATLSTTTPGVAISQPFSLYPDMPTNSVATNSTPFQISTSPSFLCGAPVNLVLLLKTDQGTISNSITLLSGTQGTAVRVDNSIPLPIPDGSPVGAYSAVTVSNVTTAISKVTVSLQINHTYDSDLLIQLISPDGTTNLLSASNGGAGQNYGINCSPDSFRTTFDDDAPTSISAGVPPWTGLFKPQQPLAIFAGKSGTNINGTWFLHVVDQLAFFSGTLNCWSLNLIPAQCPDGGGQCPGADLAIGMSAVPSPVVASNNMTYSISVTNNGPSSTRNVSVSQVLPGSVTFVSATSSQGSCSQAGGVVSCKLGGLDLRATATISVVVQPRTPGTIVSTATVSSEQPDPVPANNSAVVITQVLPVASDLSASIAASPPAPLAGAPMTYTVTVVNGGPSTATGVIATNVLPAGFAVGTPAPSQGHATVFGNVVVWFLDSSLLAGASANLTIPVIPNTNGTFTATARVTGDQNDPNLSNNFASVITAIGPSSDLAVGLVGMPNPVVLQSRLTYRVVVTNLGPSTASGIVLNGSLPTSIDVTSNYLSQGSLSVSNGALFADLGTLASGATATVVLYTTPNVAGTINASVNVAASQADPNPANNTASVSTIVSRPFISVVQAGVQLVGESFTPPDGAIEVGEIVTNSFRLLNVGNVNTTNIVATLLATNGILPINPATHAPLASYSQTYGVLAPSGFAVARSFTFIASATNGPTVGATFQVQDTVGGYSTNLTFTFVLPTSSTFANTNAILIPDPAAPNPPYASQSGPASPYPSTLTVSGVSNTVGRVTVTLSNLSHSFVKDVSALLVGPSGAKTLLMSHAGFPNGVANVNLTFSDSAPAPLPASGGVSSGFWQPSGYSPPVFPGSAPAGPYPTSLSAFNGLDPNGTWTLYVFDDGPGDSGQIAQGWSLTFTNVSPVNPVVDLTLTEVAAPNPVTVNGVLTCTFTVSNASPVAASGVTFSNAVPQTVTNLFASASLGSCTTNAGVALCSIPTLAPGATSVITVTFTPTISGSLTNTGSVSSLATDLHASDNTAAAVVAVSPQPADIALAFTAPASVVIGSNLTYTITITNTGPGVAGSVIVTNPLPASVSFVTSHSAQAAAVLYGTNLVSTFGSLPVNGAATNQIVVKALQLGTFTNFASASLPSNQADPIPTNNSAVTLVQIMPPFLNLVIAGVSLTAESGPTNGAIDPGERVTVQFALRNAGTIPNTNLTVTLQAAGGVLSPSGSQNYGQLLPGGASVSRPFSFTNGAAVGGPLIATLHLQDSGGLVTNLTYAFAVVNGFTNANAISIAQNGAASPYPSTIALSGLTGVVSKVAVTLYGLTHSFPSDVNVLLVNPAGASVVLMSHAGGAHPVTNATLTFDDAASAALSSAAAITSGTYRPSAYGSVVFPSPAPGKPYGSSLAALNGIDASGTNTWSLYVYDDSNGDGGAIASGWSLNVTTFNPINPLADLAVGLAAYPGTVFPHDVITYTIGVTNLGPSTASNVVVTGVMPASFTVLSNQTAQGINFVSGTTITNNLGTLAAGAAATVTVFASPRQSGAYTATASVAGIVTDLNLANNSASLTALVSSEGAFSGYYSGGLFHLTISGAPGGTHYSFQATTNLPCSSCWTTISTAATPAVGALTVTDTNTPSFTRRYYRAVRLTP